MRSSLIAGSNSGFRPPEPDQGNQRSGKGSLSEITINEHNYLLSASLNRKLKRSSLSSKILIQSKPPEDEKGFCLNVAHELRTPLTAIRDSWMWYGRICQIIAIWK
jgi:signal transduction histidine kinase